MSTKLEVIMLHNSDKKNSVRLAIPDITSLYVMKSGLAKLGAGPAPKALRVTIEVIS